MTRTYLKNDLDSEEIVASFYEKELNGKLKIVYSHQEKRCLNYMLIGKAILILLTVGLIKKDISISALAVLFGILIGITQFCNRIKILYITRMN